jgi:hypothetical protein
VSSCCHALWQGFQSSSRTSQSLISTSTPITNNPIPARHNSPNPNASLARQSNRANCRHLYPRPTTKTLSIALPIPIHPSSHRPTGLSPPKSLHQNLHHSESFRTQNPADRNLATIVKLQIAAYPQHHQHASPTPSLTASEKEIPNSALHSLSNSRSPTKR